jgi:hypothetical protein
MLTLGSSLLPLDDRAASVDSKLDDAFQAVIGEVLLRSTEVGIYARRKVRVAESVVSRTFPVVEVQTPHRQ